MSTKPKGYLSDSEIEAKKTASKQKNLHEIITEDDDGVQYATYFKKPTLDNMQMLADYSKKSQEIKGLEVLFNTCRVAGADEVLTDDEMKISAMKALANLFQRREAKVKKR